MTKLIVIIAIAMLPFGFALAKKGEIISIWHNLEGQSQWAKFRDGDTECYTTNKGGLWCHTVTTPIKNP